MADVPLPQIALIVSAFERPNHLQRCLASIAAQSDVQNRIEVIVADDGSQDETERVVAEFAQTSGFPVKFTTHERDGFWLSRSRNEGVIASSAPYLLFLDGDCVLPQGHISHHLARRQRSWAVAGDCFRLDRAASDRLTLATIRSGRLLDLVSQQERQRISGKARRAMLYEWLRLPMRPRMTGNNIGMWRKDFEAINGFDERFVGWGLEDRDLQRRLLRLGVRVRTILPWTAAFHLWHRSDPTYVRNGIGTANLAYFRRRDVPMQCERGLTQRRRMVLQIRDYAKLSEVGGGRGLSSTALRVG